MRLLVIVDMQNDFITGSLKNKDAESIVDGICYLISKWGHDDQIVLTQDTHDWDYLKTQEGKYLPTEHCIKNTAGWCIHDNILRYLRKREKSKDVYHTHEVLEKSSFGAVEGLGDLLDKWETFKEIVFVGTCTDICVVSNALFAKSALPETRIVVISDFCAGTSKTNHEAALKVMRSCQIDVVDSKTYLKEASAK